MKELSVDLIEDLHNYYFSIDNRGKHEHLLFKKSGLLKRIYSGNWQSQALALSSIPESGKHLSRHVNVSGLKADGQHRHLNSTKLIREHEGLLNYLHTLQNVDWKVIFRINRNKRIVVRKKGKPRESCFNYHSLLIKLKLPMMDSFIEVGEGYSNNINRFNQDGLCQRISDILSNQKENKSISIKGAVPLVLNSGDGAILFHEILGHSLEADSIYRNLSPFSLGDQGKRVVSANINLVTDIEGDDFFQDVITDDEGESPQSATLVHRGVLKNFISDYFYKNLLGINNSGHSRVQDFTKIPMPRMFALYLEGGAYDPGELIESTKLGVYAKEFGEGKVYFDRNLFYFTIHEAYLIENGKLSSPLGNIKVRGEIPETLNSVVMVANDFRLDKGISYCYKNGQTLNVRVGQPTVKIANLHITKESND